jgi:hypothetical protein
MALFASMVMCLLAACASLASADDSGGNTLDRPQQPAMVNTVENNTNTGIQPALQDLPALSKDGKELAFVAARGMFGRLHKRAGVGQ